MGVTLIKKCNVVIHNKEIIVVKYDDILVQFPNKLDMFDSTLYVKCKNNKYILVTEEEYKKSISKKVTKKDNEKNNRDDIELIDIE